MSKQRVTYTPKNFPFDLLRVGGAGKKNAKRSEFGTAHQETFIETSPGNLQEYIIQFEELLSNAMSYWLNPNGKAMKDPSVYLHLTVHPKWSTLNEAGEISHTTSPTGVEIEEFWAKFTVAFNRECHKIPEDDRVWLMGDGPMAETPDEKTTFLAPVLNHPKFGEGHPKVGRRDLDKPKTMSMALWVQNITKRGEVDKKKKYSNLKSSSSVNATEVKNDDLMIPDTDIVIFTGIYDLTTANKRKIGVAKAGDQIKDYEQIKKFIYNANGHPNASPNNSDMIVKTSVLGPSVNWDINGKPGELKMKAKEIKVTSHKEKKFNRAIPVSEITAMEAETKRKRAEFGLSDESDDEDGTQKQDQEEVKEKEPLFKSEFERVNYGEQRDCEKQLKVLEDRYDVLDKQRNDPNTTELKQRAIEKEITIISQKVEKKRQDLADLQNELEEMQVEEDNDEEDGGEYDDDDDDSGCEPPKKKARHD